VNAINFSSFDINVSVAATSLLPAVADVPAPLTNPFTANQVSSDQNNS
jgi:hypothetical protein